MVRVSTVLRLAAPLALALMVSACALTTRHASIAELKYNPGRFQDRSVTVQGVVTSSWGAPFVPFRLYKVNDGTGEVTVVAHDGRVPTRGARVRVRGKVNELATVGGRAIGLHLEQQDLDFRR